MEKLAPPEGVFPLFLRGGTCEKYGFKTGEGVKDLVDYLYLKKEDLLKEIQVAGVMSDFEPAKKQIESCPRDTILVVVDKLEQYSETFLLCYTAASQDAFFAKLQEELEAIEAQKQAEIEAENARAAAAWARANIVYEDKPLLSRPWVSAHSAEVEVEVRHYNPPPCREIISMEIWRPKKDLKKRCIFNDRTLEGQTVIEFKAARDTNFVRIKESECGFQVAPTTRENTAQTTWYQPVNKAVQYESAATGTDTSTDAQDDLLAFLDRVTVRIENALQQNESVDIFHETFELPKHGDDEAHDDHADSELRELKNFGDPMYTKGTVIVAIDWMPKVHGMVAVSPVKSASFDERVLLSGQTSTSYILLWDFKQLVKPQVLMQSPYEIFSFRFNPKIQGLVAGGTITGQVILWDINDALLGNLRRSNRGQTGAIAQNNDDDDDAATGPVLPKFISSVDHSHKRCVAELYWLPPNSQINYRGQLVGPEHLDGNSYQFLTIAGDGLVLIWDIRFEQIAQDELRHIGRAKHIVTEKTSRDGQPKALWSPIFRAHLKRLEGVGELSLCKISGAVNVPPKVSAKSSLPGDIRSHLMIGTEEGDIIFADISARKAETAAAKEEEDEKDEGDAGRDFVRWIANDHARPAVGFQLSPFFSDVLLSVSDWCFNIWKIGDEKPLFSSPLSKSYLTAGAWSPSRPAVILVACCDGSIQVWDFTDSSFRPSIELKATTPNRLTSMEFLTNTTTSRKQMLAAGDDKGTLHIYEMPRNLTKPIPNEDTVMRNFLDREEQRYAYIKSMVPQDATPVDEHDHYAAAAPVGEVKVDPVAAAEEAQKAAAAALKKEDDEFAKLEAAFLAELGEVNPNAKPVVEDVKGKPTARK